MALVRATAALDTLQVAEEERVGVQIVRRAMEESARRIATNAGADDSVVLEKIKSNKGAFGFNAASEEFEDLLKAGIIDPIKVVRTALQNAASVASLLLTTEAVVPEKPEEKKAMPPAPHPEDL